MSIIAKFRKRLDQINASVLSETIPNLAVEMAYTTQQLRTEYGDISRGMNDQQGIANAVIAFLDTQQLKTYRDIKYVCFGISSPYGTPSALIIEHSVLLPQLLTQVEQLKQEPRKFRRCYQGLLKGYLRYSGCDEKMPGHKNWIELRGFLNQHYMVLKKQKPIMEWVQSLYEHRNLLTVNPCKPYAKALLAGDTSIVEVLQNKLGIDDDTWVMNELVLAHVQAATALNDVEFVKQVTSLVQLLEKHSGLITKGLALLIKRYEACKEHAEHHVLRDAVLQEWKSPWLEANIPLWYGLVGIDSTKMVRLWLTKQHIKDFFVLLQAGGQADTQRMEFWLQYAEAIDDFWLALGSYSFNNQRADFKRIRTQMEGHCMKLVDSNQNNDNAFLMKIGNFVYIEFGKPGNACHIFSADNLPFKIGQTTVSGTGYGLKNTRHPGWQKKLSHFDGWQKDFADFLHIHSNATHSEYKKLEAPLNKVNSIKPQQEPLYEIKHLHLFCDPLKLQIDDMRVHGGALWVRTSDTNVLIADMLKKFGLEYKHGKGWWKE